MEKAVDKQKRDRNQVDPWILENADKLDDYDGPDLDRKTTIEMPAYMKKIIADRKAKKGR